MAASSNYQTLQELVIEYQSTPIRFWLPKDRPLSQIVEAIIHATPSPFPNAPNPAMKYDLKTEDGHTPLDLTETISRLKLMPNKRLVLETKATRQLRLKFQRGGYEITRIAKSGDIIGVKKDDSGIPTIDLSEFANTEGRERISRRHAEIRLDQNGDFLCKVLHPNGIFVPEDGHYEEGSIMLTDKMRLLVVDVWIGIDIE
jgi:hypothetical protein